METRYTCVIIAVVRLLIDRLQQMLTGQGPTVMQKNFQKSWHKYYIAVSVNGAHIGIGGLQGG